MDLTFEWYGDTMVFCVFMFLFQFFCLEETLGEDTYMRATSATVLVFFRKCHSESFLISTKLTFLLHNYEVTLTTAF